MSHAELRLEAAGDAGSTESEDYRRVPPSYWWAYTYPQLRKRGLPMLEVLQRPGDTIYVPPRWWHAVINLPGSDEAPGEVLTLCVTQNVLTAPMLLRLLGWPALRAHWGEFALTFAVELRRRQPAVAAVLLAGCGAEELGEIEAEARRQQREGGYADDLGDEDGEEEEREDEEGEEEQATTAEHEHEAAEMEAEVEAEVEVEAGVGSGAVDAEAQFLAEVARRAQAAAAARRATEGATGSATEGATERATERATEGAVEGAAAAATGGRDEPLYEVRRVPATELSLADFRRRYVRCAVPVLLTGLGGALTSPSPMTAAWLAGAAGTKQVGLRVQPRGESDSESAAEGGGGGGGAGEGGEGGAGGASGEGGEGMAVLPLATLIERMARGEARGLYMYDVPIRQRLPSLLHYLKLPRHVAHCYLRQTRSMHAFSASWPTLFLGGEGTRSSLHVDQNGRWFRRSAPPLGDHRVPMGRPAFLRAWGAPPLHPGAQPRSPSSPRRRRAARL